MMAALIVVVACLVAILAGATFRRARRLAAGRLPTALGAELRVHKLECLGEPPMRVDLELQLLLGEDAPRARDDAPQSEAPGCGPPSPCTLRSRR
jgi:hypothetical protein